ncbi:MAG: DMT family transporter [Planctomycetes bacterium]|nr:DMT family transporter [Planctomycetota bacterium]
MRHLGEIAAVSAAACWTVSSLAFAYSGRRLRAPILNQVRIVFAVALLSGLHLLLLGTLVPAAAEADAVLYLAASGVVGLALGDHCNFHCLSVIGPRYGSLLMATHPAMSVLLAWPFLGEAPSGGELGGVALTTAGVALVLLRRRPGAAWRPEATPRERWVAVGAGLLGALGQAGGLLLSRSAFLVPSATPLDPLSATWIRMVAGMTGIFAIALLSRDLVRPRAVLADRPGLGTAALGAVFGPTAGVWLVQVAAAHTRAGVASALSSLTPILVLPLSRVLYGARITILDVIGTLTVVAGAGLLFGVLGG